VGLRFVLWALEKCGQLCGSPRHIPPLWFPMKDMLGSVLVGHNFDSVGMCIWSLKLAKYKEIVHLMWNVISLDTTNITRYIAMNLHETNNNIVNFLDLQTQSGGPHQSVRRCWPINMLLTIHDAQLCVSTATFPRVRLAWHQARLFVHRYAINLGKSMYVVLVSRQECPSSGQNTFASDYCLWCPKNPSGKGDFL
jgi:hypothetical protein